MHAISEINDIIPIQVDCFFYLGSKEARKRGRERERGGGDLEIVRDLPLLSLQRAEGTVSPFVSVRSVAAPQALSVTPMRNERGCKERSLTT